MLSVAVYLERDARWPLFGARYYLAISLLAGGKYELRIGMSGMAPN